MGLKTKPAKDTAATASTEEAAPFKKSLELKSCSRLAWNGRSWVAGKIFNVTSEDMYTKMLESGHFGVYVEPAPAAAEKEVEVSGSAEETVTAKVEGAKVEPSKDETPTATKIDISDDDPEIAAKLAAADADKGVQL